MNCEFWMSVLNNFIANIASDILVGIVLGALLALWVGNKLNAWQRSQQRKDEKIAETEKVIHYLALLKDEVTYLCNNLPGLIEAFSKTGWGSEIQLPTPFWDVLQPSGELPRVLEPQLLASLAIFYENITYAKRGRDLVIDGWLVPQPRSVPGMEEKLQAFIAMTLKGLKDALYYGRNLPDTLDKKIKELESQLELLNSE